MKKITRLFSMLLLMLVAMGAYAQEEMTVTYSSNDPTAGAFYRQSNDVEGGWAKVTSGFTKRWESYGTPSVVISMQYNNMDAATFSFYSGSSQSPYVLSIETEYLITGLEIKFVNKNQDGSHNQTITCEEQSATSEGGTEAHLSVLDLEGVSTLSFEITGTNTGATINAFIIHYIENPEKGMAYIDDIVSNNPFDASQYPIGTGGGYYPETLVNAAETAYNDMLDWQVSGGSNDELIAAGNAYLQALQALKDGQYPVVVTAGNYYILNARNGDANEVIADLTAETNVDVLSTVGEYVGWTPNATTAQDETAQPAYLWTLEAASDTSFYIKSLAFDKYVPNIKSTNAILNLVDSQDEAAKFYFQTSTTHPGWVTIRNAEIVGLGKLTDNAYLYSFPYSSNNGRYSVLNAGNTYASQWKLVPLSAEALAALEENIKALKDSLAQIERNEQMETLLSAAREAEAAGKAYIITPGTYDGMFPVDSTEVEDPETGETSIQVSVNGLVTSPAQIYSNAKDPGEGSYEGLFDGVYTTFFHTSWHSSLQATEPHYLQIDLGQANLEDIVLKCATRSNAGVPDLPYEVTLYGTNDASLLSGVETTEEDPETGEQSTVISDVPSSSWTNLGNYTMAWNTQLKNAAGEDVSVSNRRTSAPINKGASIAMFNVQGNRYIRVAVTKNLQHAATGNARTNGDGFDYWYLSELRAYEATYDQECIYEKLDAKAKQDLAAAIANGAQQLAEGKTTQEALEQLTAAYEAFMAVYPSSDKLNSKISEAKTWYDKSVEGAEVGQYEEGSRDALNSVIGTAEAAAETVLTYDVYQSNMTALDNAIETFIGKVKTPVDGIYKIQSLTSGAAKGAYVCTDGTGSTDDAYSNVRWSYANDTEIDNRLNALWELKHVDGGITLRNLATNRYITNEQVTLSGHIAQTDAPHTLGLRGARIDTITKALNITLYNDSVKYFANAQPGGAVMVVWNSAQGTDNSAFEFIKVNDDEFTSTMILEHSEPYTVHLLPFEIAAPTTTVYTVTGIKDNAVQLEAILSDAIPAGTPFICAEDTAVAKDFSVYLTVFSAGDIVYSYANDGLKVNGMTAVWEPDSVGANHHVIGTADPTLLTRRAALLQTTKNSVVPANDAYFTITGMPEATVDGDAYIPLEKAIVDGVEKVVLGDIVVKNNRTYNINGQQVKSTKNLPAGVYIINGKKVYVK